MPRSRTADRRYYGVVEAIVAENEGDDEGRIKVKFPWFDGNAAVTEWCRVSQLYAGNGYGSVFVPEKGDEVLVAFIHGDLRFPIIIGGLYNGVDKPPTARTGGRDQKIIRTRHGHEVLLDDTRQQAAVRVRSAAGHVVEMDDEGTAIRITAAAGGTVTVTADGSITLTAPEITIESNDIDLGGGSTEPLVLGNALLSAFNTHIHPAPVGVTGPPTTPLTPAAVLARKSRTA